MEADEKTKKEAAKSIHEAAEHAGNGEYTPALEKINETIQVVNGIFPLTFEELQKARKFIEMYVNSEGEEKNEYTEEYIYHWLESIAEELESTIF